MRQSAKEAKLERAMKAGEAAERREAIVSQAGAEFADELGMQARSGGGYVRRHPPATRG